MAAPERRPSETRQRATAFVEQHREEADALGIALADLVHDPDAFATELAAGFEQLGDAAYRAGQHAVAPGLGRTWGVRYPLMTAVMRSLARASRGTSSALLLFVADRLLREEYLDARWFAFRLLEQTIGTDPERTWQLLRRAARDAADWITVDSLAHPVARGILDEPFRWAEIEQLVFSPSRWERRLVGSAIATAPYVDHRAGRSPAYVERGIAALGELIGDAEPEVQKALAWAYRSIAMVDSHAATRALAREAEHAAATADGNRARVVRDAVSRLAPQDADRIRATLAGVRRRADAQPTSRASAIALQFAAGAGPAPQPTNVR